MLQGGADRPAIQRADEARLLCQLNELGRLDQPAAQVTPAGERLGAHQLTGHETVHGLVVEVELVVLEGPAQVGLHTHLLLHEAPQLGAVELEPGAFGLGAVHGQVGRLEQRVEVAPVLGVHGDADAGADGDLVALVGGAAGHVRHHAGRDAAGGGGVAHLGEEDGELVAAEPCHQVRLADALLQRCGDLLQQGVAGVVAQGVVDGLEAVQVDIEHRQRLSVAPRQGDALVAVLGEEAPVRQARQGVVVGELMDLRFEPLARRDVTERDQDAAHLGVVEKIPAPGVEVAVATVPVL